MLPHRALPACHHQPAWRAPIGFDSRAAPDACLARLLRRALGLVRLLVRRPFRRPRLLGRRALCRSGLDRLRPRRLPLGARAVGGALLPLVALLRWEAVEVSGAWERRRITQPMARDGGIRSGSGMREESGGPTNGACCIVAARSVWSSGKPTCERSRGTAARPPSRAAIASIARSAAASGDASLSSGSSEAPAREDAGR